MGNFVYIFQQPVLTPSISIVTQLLLVSIASDVFEFLICIVFLSNFFLSSSPAESLGLPEYSDFPAQVPPPNASFASLQMFCQEARGHLSEERQTHSLIG